MFGYLLSAGNDASTVVSDLIDTYAYPREEGGVKVYYNNVKGSCSDKQKRDGDGGCSLSTKTASLLSTISGVDTTTRLAETGTTRSSDETTQTASTGTTTSTAPTTMVTSTRSSSISETETETPTATTTSPKPTQTEPAKEELKCAGLDNKRWVERDALRDAVDKYCEEAEAQGVQDKDSGSLVRKYNSDNPDHVSISMDWPSSSSFKPTKDTCVKHLATVVGSCDGNQPDKNPMNWKHGGYYQVGEVRYNINPIDERYKAGKCSIHVKEKEEFWGVDRPGTSRKHLYWVKVEGKDADGNVFAGTNNKMVSAGDGNTYNLKGYYDTLEITPEARGDYIQFSIGDQSWRSGDEEGSPRCNLGAWDGVYSGSARDMDCFFDC